MSTSPNRERLLALADGVADAATHAGPVAIAKARARGFDVSFIEDGQLLIESADGTMRARMPPGEGSTG